MPLHPKDLVRPETILRTIAAVPVAAIIFFAIWIAGSSVYENIRFSRAADQIYGLIGAARDYADREKNFASHDGDNLLVPLVRSGAPINATVTEQTIQMTNPWHGGVTLTASPPNAVRLETIVPTRDCRRFAASFIKDASNLGLKMMEAQEGGNGAWRRFYDGSQAVSDDTRPITAACGQAENAGLALVFRLR